MATITYHVTALQMTIYFNREGDHDHNGFTVRTNREHSIVKIYQSISRI
jgi:hypothetical protein